MWIWGLEKEGTKNYIIYMILHDSCARTCIYCLRYDFMACKYLHKYIYTCDPMYGFIFFADSSSMVLNQKDRSWHNLLF